MGNRPNYDQLLQRVKDLEHEIYLYQREEDEFKQREAKLRAILDDGTTVIYLKDSEGRYLMVNKSFEMLCRIRSDQVIGKTDLELFPRDFAEQLRENDLTVIRKKQAVEFEEEIPVETGKITCRTIKFPLIDNQGYIYAVCGISSGISVYSRGKLQINKTHHDNDRSTDRHTDDLFIANERLKQEIDDRNQAEQNLRESEQKFRQIFENLQDVYFETTPDGTIIYTTPSGPRLSGYSMDELIGNNVAMLYYNIADRDPLLNELKSKGKIRNYETIFKNKNGSTFNVSVNADIYYDDANRPKTIYGTIRDITHYIRMKEKVQRMSKMKSLGIMAGGIAHDLNNILSGLVTYPEVLLMGLPEDSTMKKPLQIIKDSGKRAADVVADLLTIAKGVATDKNTLSLNTMVREVLQSDDCTNMKDAHPDIQYTHTLDPELLNITGSIPHIRIMVQNLLINASEAIKGRGSITLTTENRFLEKSSRIHDHIKCGEYVVLRVSDSGEGIPQDHIDQIFEPFFTKKTMKRSGSGLGLAVVWNIVQEHGGYVDVKSSSKGTVFELYLPATRDSVDISDTAPCATDYLGHGEHILVVDDEAHQREIACELLSRLGYEAHAVSSGEAALDYLRNNAVDLMILDMIMEPGIDGCETYARALQIKPDQKALIVSGYTSSESVETARQLGAGQFIKKPYTLDKIGPALSQALKKSDNR